MGSSKLGPNCRPRPISNSSTGAIRHITVALLLPLFFLIFFPLTYVGALNSPAPRDLPIGVAGPHQVTNVVLASFRAHSAFDPTWFGGETAARRAVDRAQVDGAIVVLTDPTSGRPMAIESLVASGGGVAVPPVVDAIGSRLATRLHIANRLVDVAPTKPGDKLASGIFYLLVFSTLSGYLVVIGLSRRSPGTREYLVAAACTAVATPAAVFFLSGWFLGGYGVTPSEAVAILAIDALYVLTITLLAIGLAVLLPKLSVYALMAVLVFLNFPSAGGAVPAALLPQPWQVIHQFYFGSSAYEAMRGIQYFGGRNLENWLPRLLAWLAIAILALAIITVLRRRHGGADKTESNSAPGAVRHSWHRSVLTVATLPVWFVVCFSIAYPSALHSPTPQGTTLTVAGDRTPEGTLARYAAAATRDGFATQITHDPEDAYRRVASRSVDGALIVASHRVTPVVASAGGVLTAEAIEQSAERLASHTRPPGQPRDVVPLSADDSAGTGLFYWMITCTIGGYLTPTVLQGVLRISSRRTRLAVASATALFVPSIAFAIQCLYVRTYGADALSTVEGLCVAAMYTFTVAAFTLFAFSVSPRYALPAIVVVLMALNFPSSSGAVPASLLPPFWQLIHGVWIGSGMLEAERSIFYFHGYGASRWIWQLATWLVVLGVSMVIVRPRGSTQQQK